MNGLFGAVERFRLVGNTRHLAGRRTITLQTRNGLGLLYQVHTGVRLAFGENPSAAFELKPDGLKFMRLPEVQGDGNLTIQVEGEMTFQLIDTSTPSPSDGETTTDTTNP